MVEAAAPPSVARQLFAQRDFMLYLGARIFNTLGIQMQEVAIGWEVYQMTSNPLDLGFVGLSQFAPMFGLFLLAGYVADRFDRRAVLVGCYLAQAITGTILYLLAASHMSAVWPIFLTLSVFGSARAISQPASQALVPNLVPKSVFPVAVAWTSSASKLSSIVGPAVGGVLYAVVGLHVFVVIGALFAASVVMMFVVRSGLRFRRAEPGLASVLSGFSYIWNKPVIFGAISLDLFAVIFSGVNGLLPVFSSDILHVGAEGLGFLRAAPAVGASLMALVLTQMPPMRRTGYMLFATVAVFGGSILAFGLSTWFLLSLAALFVLGASDMISVYIRQTLVQIKTPDEMRGRVSAVNSISINASNELGYFRSGVMAAWLGTVPAVVIGGIVTLTVCALWSRFFPELRRADRLDEA